ncbi:MAG TPA: hypothetical protein VFA20_09560 [Myxococcaceae bacterium]|nr:hypothetical protein [Myxococcaceae bacterium]
MSATESAAKKKVYRAPQVRSEPVAGPPALFAQSGQGKDPDPQGKEPPREPNYDEQPK